MDYQSWWGIELDCHPSIDVTCMDRVLALYTALWDAGVTADIRHPEDDLSPYRLVVVPGLYAVTDKTCQNIESFVEGGGHLFVAYFSGVVDDSGQPPGVEVVRRTGDERSFVFVINHTEAAATVPAAGVDLVSGADCAGTVTVPAGGVAIVGESGVP